MASRTSVEQSLLYFFDRPNEPVFFPKGDQDVIFKVPSEYLNERNKTISDELPSRFGVVKEEIEIRRIDLPDLSEAKRLGRHENFSTFIPYHRKLAGQVIRVLLGMRNVEDLRSAIAWCRENLNPYLFIYATSVALLHRPDTRNLPIPPLVEILPDRFLGGGILNRIREESNVFTTDGTRIPLILPLDYTASDLEEEHRVAYWREDLGINLHHWHWHLVYPFDGPDQVVRKDRRGELFYYMHQQIIARYNFERFCNRLGRVKRLLNLREPIREAYFPKLDSLVASRVWPARPSNTVLQDIDREQEQLKFDIQDLERWRDRIYDVIHTGTVQQEDGKIMNLTEENGIDILGNIMEASSISINQRIYGNLHNLGHVAIALSHDPDNRHLETFGVMGDSTTAMRDPVFYRWHAFVDDVFQEHKATLPPYSLQRLRFDGITVTGLSVQTDKTPQNVLRTFYQQSDVNLTRGMDFTPRGPVFARVTHLNHNPFTYNITVNNSGQQQNGTVRIFLAPKFDERGITLLFRDQRNLFIELDRFTVNLKSGNNNIQRRSSESSVTIPFSQVFRDLTTNRPTEGSPGLAQFNFCGCGWPEYMLIPKGTPEGYPCELFVMVTNFMEDRVEQMDNTPECDDASSYCGLRNKKYPDRRAMGFPFDRPPRDGVNTLTDFRRNVPNIAVADVSIRFTPPDPARNMRGLQ